MSKDYFSEILEVLGELHKEAPQIRFNQFISNLHSEFVKQNPSVGVRMSKDMHPNLRAMEPVIVPDLFYVSDVRFLSFLKQELANITGVKPITEEEYD